MSSEESEMTMLFQNLNQAYHDIAQFLTRINVRRRQLIESGRQLTDPEVIMLQNIIESTENQLNQLAESMRRLRKDI